MIKRGIQTAVSQNSVTIAIDRNQPHVVIIAHPVNTFKNEMSEPQDTGNYLTGIDFILIEIKLDHNYDLKMKELERELKDLTILKDMIDLDPEEIA